MNNDETDIEPSNKLDGKVKLLWHLGWYDGILSGVGLYKKEHVYFSLLQEFNPIISADGEDYNDGWYRKYTVFKLNPDDQLRLHGEHALFQVYVGFNSDHYPLSGRQLMAPKKTTIPSVHGGYLKNTKDSWPLYEEHLKKWREAYGTYKQNKDDVIGYIFYDQLN